MLGGLKRDLYEKYALKYNDEISKIRQELTSSSFDRSNFNLIIEKGLTIAEKLSQLWLSSDFSSKQKLQYLVFPQGILYNKEKDTVRTLEVNALFAEIPPLKWVLDENEKGNLEKDCLESCSVPGTGIELSKVPLKS